jgi:hypothetical protein
MNTFDFYFVVASSPRKSAFKKAGIPAGNLSTTKEIVRYGRRAFPRFTYHATVGHAEPTEAGSNEAEVVANKYRNLGLSVSVKYHCSD